MIVNKENQNSTSNTEKKANLNESLNSGEPVFDPNIGTYCFMQVFDMFSFLNYFNISAPLQSRKTNLSSPKSRFVKLNKKSKDHSG